ncbi:hypothetical protein N2M06_13370 [Oceanimonas sp. AH20CE76]|uniref:hypothetical protein n=1 Tax=Oceanimonas sp. AH20CE76 TaxID=2977120 RepID=UPI0031FE448A
MSNGNKPVKFDDLADDDLPSEKLNDAQQVLSWKSFDAKSMAWLRIISMGVAIVLAILFLLAGLWYTHITINSVINHTPQEKPAIVIAKPAEEQKTEPSAQVKSSTAASSETAKANAPEKENWDKTLISSGSIITLIAFVMGVGLTLILAVVKLSIAANKPNEPASEYVGMAGPFSELITQFANWLKRKG